ncbi:glycosyltransferase [Nocardia callitridis]|uniref:Glycosyltransferase n=2 Tax=Nocardia callitridis TaxID=648753 RepID=A0ABP9KKR8_9NOCA
MKALAEIRDLGWSQAVSDMAAMYEGADAIVTGFITEQIAQPYAESLGVPCLSLHHAPIRPTRHIGPVPGAPALPPLLNSAMWTVAQYTMWLLTRNRQNELRRRLGVSGAAGVNYRGALEIQAYDPLLCQELVREWAGQRRPFVGFLNLSREQRVRIGLDSTDDPGLAAWFEAGDAPVYFGFGSMPVPDVAATAAAIVDAAQRVGVRALISSGWGALAAAVAEDDRVRVVGAVDHDRIFPRCRAVVHHGGAGTTAAALRAGVPSLVCWVGSDQPYWGARCVRYGVGETTRLPGIDADILTEKLATILSSEYTRRARALAEGLISPEQAVRRCADLIERSVHDRATHADDSESERT